MQQKLIIISVPLKKHYVVRTDDNSSLVGDASISGFIVGVGETYEEAEQILNNLL